MENVEEPKLPEPPMPAVSISLPEGYGRHRGVCSVFFEGKWLIADHSNGTIYAVSMGEFTDDGQNIPRVRRTQVIRSNGQRLFHNSLELMFETGVGVNEEPTVQLSWSDDFCKTWSAPRARGLGMEADLVKRVFWNRLGQSRHRVYELYTDAPAPFRLVGCVSNVDGSND